MRKFIRMAITNNAGVFGKTTFVKSVASVPSIAQGSNIMGDDHFVSPLEGIEHSTQMKLGNASALRWGEAHLLTNLPKPAMKGTSQPLDTKDRIPKNLIDLLLEFWQCSI